MPQHRNRVGWIAALAVLLGAGCVSSTLPPDASQPTPRPKLVRIQTGRDVTLQWPAELGKRYRVVYTPNIENPSAWRALPGFENVPGTRGTQTVTFQAPLPGRLHYRVQTLP